MTDLLKPSDLVAELLEHVPELKCVYDEHINDYEELLPHVFFGDATRYVVQQAKDGFLASDQPVSRILRLFEVAMAGSEDVQELVSVSFLENLVGNEEVIRELASMMGPALKTEVAKKNV